MELKEAIARNNEIDAIERSREVKNWAQQPSIGDLFMLFLKMFVAALPIAFVVFVIIAALRT